MTVWNASVITSYDDGCQESSGYTERAGSLDCTSAYSHVLMRFQNVTIPAGATITAATLTVNVTNAAYDSPNLRIHCEDIDDAPTIASSSGSNISNRTLTAAYTTWNAADIGTGSKTSPDLTSAVQEVIDRAGWASGNDIAVIMVQQTGGALRMTSYDTGTAPAIDITYTTPSGTAQSKTARVRLSTKIGGGLTS